MHLERSSGVCGVVRIAILIKRSAHGLSCALCSSVSEYLAFDMLILG